MVVAMGWWWFICGYIGVAISLANQHSSLWNSKVHLLTASSGLFNGTGWLGETTLPSILYRPCN